MNRTTVTGCRLIAALIAAVVVCTAAAPARAGWPFEWPPSLTPLIRPVGCQTCGPCGGAAHASTPYGDLGCGPKYCGAVHDDPCGVDPCDSCNRWRGCNGARQSPDMLAPWQLPPGRGFQTAAQVGYDGTGGGGICTDCRRPPYMLW